MYLLYLVEIAWRLLFGHKHWWHIIVGCVIKNFFMHIYIHTHTFTLLLAFVALNDLIAFFYSKLILHKFFSFTLIALHAKCI